MTNFVFSLATFIHLFVIMFVFLRKNKTAVATILIFTIAFGVVIYRLFGLSSYWQNKSLADKLVFNLSSKCKAPVLNPDSNKTVVLRLDDVQAFSWTNVSTKMIEDANKYGMPLVLGVIPFNLDEDKTIVEYLKRNKCKNEIALHGFKHQGAEYAELDQATAYNITLQGKTMLEKVTTQNIESFIPPENEISASAHQGVIDAGIARISSNKGGVFDTNVSMYDYVNKKLFSANEVWQKCQDSFASQQTCIVMLHPQEFAASETEFDSKKYQEYINLIKHIADSGVRVTTIANLKAEGNQNVVEITDSTRASTWVADWNYESTISYVSKNENIDYIMPILYEVNTQGEIIKVETNLQEAVKSLKGKVKILPTLVNRVDKVLAEKLLSDPSTFDKKVSYLISEVKINNYNGLDVDIENIDPVLQPNFNLFIQKLSVALRQNKYELSVTVPIKTTDGQWKVAYAYNWKLLGGYADRIRVMAYDIHNTPENPGSIIPVRELKEGIGNAVKNIPLQKIDFALPTYAYDWFDGKVESLQYSDIESIKSSYNFNEKIDEESNSVNLKYIDEKGTIHDIWYENAETLKQKIEIINSEGIDNISFWRLGNHDPEILK